MNAVDTNVLIYRVDQMEPAKQSKARTLLRQLSSGHTSNVMIWQVLAELVRQLRRWRDQGRISNLAVRKYARYFKGMWPISLPSPSILDRALDLADAHSLSHWDSMLVAACLEAGVDTLFTEDMGAPRLIESLRLENPFI